MFTFMEISLDLLEKSKRLKEWLKAKYTDYNIGTLINFLCKTYFSPPAVQLEEKSETQK